jgi:hypothetical protein
LEWKFLGEGFELAKTATCVVRGVAGGHSSKNLVLTFLRKYVKISACLQVGKRQIAP